MADEKKKKRHRDRKNPRSAEEYQAKRKAANALRPKQIWIGGPVVEGGHWEGR